MKKWSILFASVAVASSLELEEENRYFNSNDEPINLAQSEGTARFQLYKSDDVAKCPLSDKQLNDPLVSMGGALFLTDFEVGNPPQKVRGVFDTGSTNTWILNKKTPLGGGFGQEPSKMRSYDETLSTTMIKTSQTAKIRFGSGSLGGTFYTDDVRFGSCGSGGQIHIKNQKFGNVEEQRTIFSGDNFEAIIGLGYASLAEPGVKPVFDEVMGQSLLKNNIFSFYVGSPPEMLMGYYDKSKFKGDIHWNPVEFKYMYGIKLDDFKVNGKLLNICEGQSSCLVTVDSGSSMNAFPDFVHKKLAQNKLPASGRPAPC